VVTSLIFVTFLGNGTSNVRDTADILTKQSNEEVKKLTAQVFLTPLEVQKHIFKVWERYGDFLNILFGAYPSPTAKRRCCSADMFFLEIFPVPPSRFRPVSNYFNMYNVPVVS